MKPREELGLTVITAVVFAFIATIVMHERFLIPIEALETVVLIEIFLSTFNIIILSALTANYINMYRDLRTPITRSLMIFSSALLLYAASSSPIIHTLIGVKVISIGPLTFLPEIFVAAASLTLLYENYK
ncbi:MAG: hypothetical protein ABEJ87_04370 [Candidatus Nanohalobium sp.]